MNCVRPTNTDTPLVANLIKLSDQNNSSPNFFISSASTTTSLPSHLRPYPFPKKTSELSLFRNTI